MQLVYSRFILIQLRVAITGAINTVMHVQVCVHCTAVNKRVFDDNICYEKRKLKFKKMNG